MGSDPEPRLRVIWTDPVTGRKGYAVIDRMVNGLAGGGTRMRSGVTMDEVERLARTMSYKNGAFNLPGGGAKGGVDIDPHDPEARGVLSRYVRAMRPLYRNGWGTAEDLGVSQELLNEVFAEQGVGMTVQAMLDRSGDPQAAGRRVSAGSRLTPTSSFRPRSQMRLPPTTRLQYGGAWSSRPRTSRPLKRHRVGSSSAGSSTSRTMSPTAVRTHGGGGPSWGLSNRTPTSPSSRSRR